MLFYHSIPTIYVLKAYQTTFKINNDCVYKFHAELILYLYDLDPLFGLGLHTRNSRCTERGVEHYWRFQVPDQMCDAAVVRCTCCTGCAFYLMPRSSDRRINPGRETFTGLYTCAIQRGNVRVSFRFDKNNAGGRPSTASSTVGGGTVYTPRSQILI